MGEVLLRIVNRICCCSSHIHPSDEQRSARNAQEDTVVKLGTPARFLIVLISIALIASPVSAQQIDHAASKRQPAHRIAKTGSAKSEIKDLAFTSPGKLTLTILSPSGQPSSGQTVAVMYGSSAVAQAKTNSDGRVVISGLKPGVHRVRVGLTDTLVRFWHPQFAPPHAVKKPALVDSSELVRGQYGYGYGAPMAPGLVAATVTAVGIGAVVIGKSSSSGNSAPVTPASP